MPIARSSVGSVITTPKVYSTNFPATENPLSQGGIWTNGTIDTNNTAVQTTSGLAFATQVAHSAPPFDDSIAILSGFRRNHFVQVTVANSSANLREIELLLDITLAPNLASGYEIDWTTNFGLNIYRWEGTIGVFTPLAQGITTGVTLANGDVLYAQIVNGVITVRCNGVQVYQGTDNTYSSGNPGIGFYADTNNGTPSANSSLAISSFSCGEL